MKRLSSLTLMAVVIALVLAGCGDSTATVVPAAATTPGTKARQSVTIALSYIPNVQFAPYYVAQDKGYFAAENLDVTLQYGSINDLMALVGQGKIPFALAGGDEVLQARAGGIPVTSITTQYQKYPVAVVSLKSKGILKPADLKGRTVGIPGQYGSTYTGLKAALAAANLTEEDVKVQTIGFTQREAIAQGKVDAALVFSMNEPIQLQKAGLDLNIIEISGLSNLASVGLITGDELINSNPDLVQRVTRAVTRGIKDMIDNPDAAFESTIKVAPEAKSDNPDLQKAVLKETIKFMVSDNVRGQPVGYSDFKVWDLTAQFLLDNKLIRTKVDPKAGFTNRFLNAEAGKY